MKLHWSPRSPYVRKVMIAAHELGVVDRLTLTRSVAAMTNPNREIMGDNPLAKIPTLVLDDGTALYDSRVICEFFDSLSEASLVAKGGPERWRDLTWQALGDGMLDVLILWRNERERPEEQHSAAWIAGFEMKIAAGLERLETSSGDLSASTFGIGHISIGCMLSYMDFRFAALDWRKERPRLKSWHEQFAARPSAIATEARDG